MTKNFFGPFGLPCFPDSLPPSCRADIRCWFQVSRSSQQRERIRFRVAKTTCSSLRPGAGEGAAAWGMALARWVAFLLASSVARGGGRRLSVAGRSLRLGMERPPHGSLGDGSCTEVYKPRSRQKPTALVIIYSPKGASAAPLLLSGSSHRHAPGECHAAYAS
jgi:hypothetical protein